MTPTVSIPRGVRAHIRWMIHKDFDEVMAIEAESDPRPWTENEMLTALRQRNVIGMVAQHSDRVVGFMVYELARDRIVLHKLAVAPEARRSGVGGQMAWKLVNKLNVHRRVRVDALVRESMTDGHLFLRAQGFLASRVEREAFDDTGEDGYAFAYRLDVAEIVTDGVCS